LSRKSKITGTKNQSLKEQTTKTLFFRETDISESNSATQQHNTHHTFPRTRSHDHNTYHSRSKVEGVAGDDNDTHPPPP